jgi:hypothetical protein
MLSLKRRILIISAITFVLVACFTSGYFTVTGYLKWKNKDGKAAGVEDKTTVDANARLEDLIDSETSISIIHRYIADGKTVYTENNEAKADKNIIGMNKSQLKQYYGNKGYTLIEYSSSNASLLKEIKGWPAGRYVVRNNNNKVAIYSVNDKNELVMVEETEVTMDLVPDGDRDAITTGKVYDTLDDAREYVEYSLGS